jgi:glycerol uptake facilitator-like aquaporin
LADAVLRQGREDGAARLVERGFGMLDACPFLAADGMGRHELAKAFTQGLAPLIIGLLVVAIGLGWGANAGYAINPARDFGPRLASWITGYNDAWYSANGPELYFWLPIVAPLIGGLIGGALFVFCIERFLPAAVGNPAEIGVVEATPLR